MFISKIRDIHKMIRILECCLFIGIGLFIIPSDAGACSCIWEGPFLKVAKNAPLIVLGKIMRHHPGQNPRMDVWVRETLQGALLDSGIVIQMGDGMHCRPTLDGFPPGSEWILAINGPGAKPGTGLAISHCGEYGLRVENGDVIGSIDGPENQAKRMPLQELKNKLLYPRFSQTISGRITKGKSFRRSFGSHFEFILEPTPMGWEILIKEYGRDENLARPTPPLHSMPNPREIEGWHLSYSPSDCIARPYGADAGPKNPRRFIFSPEVGKGIDGGSSGRSVTGADLNHVENFGRGVLAIEKYTLTPGSQGCPDIEWMDFSVKMEGGY